MTYLDGQSQTVPCLLPPSRCRSVLGRKTLDWWSQHADAAECRRCADRERWWSSGKLSTNTSHWQQCSQTSTMHYYVVTVLL